MRPSSDGILEAQEAYARKFVGLAVRFLLTRTTGKVTEEKGEVIAQRWLGLTEVGHIPEYEVQILGASGKTVLARVTRDHVVPLRD